VNIDEILAGLRKALEEVDEERERMARLKETIVNIITEAYMWFAEHEHELPEEGE
jgi:hypothetical protein